MLIIFFKGSFKKSFKGQYFNCFEYLANYFKAAKNFIICSQILLISPKGIDIFWKAISKGNCYSFLIL